MDRVTGVATFAAALGCALMAGLFFAFSAFMMTALGRLPAPQGIAAMQSINVAILNPVFGVVFFVASAGSSFLAVMAPFAWDQPGAGWRLLGGLLLVVGVFVVTVGFNVPLNNELDAADPGSVGGADLWRRYLTTWTAWNHVRTVAALGATASLIESLRHGG